MNNKISKIGLGLAALGRPGYINLGHGLDLEADYNESKMEQQTHLMLDKAYSIGIRYFDAAQSYGKAESFLSSWLKKRKLQDVEVGSKWGYYYTADWSVEAEKHEIKEHTIERLNLQWPESKARLDPYLKLYQIHSATFESGVLENTPVLDRLYQIKSDGYQIGLSVSGINQGAVIDAALKIQIEGEPLFDSVQTTYNILEQSAENALKKSHDAGLRTIIKEGVANGRLTSRNENASNFKILKNLSEKYQVGVDAIALSFLLSQSFVSTVLSGAAVEGHLIDNAKSVNVDLELRDQQMLRKLALPPHEYWNERSQMKWN